MKQKNENILSLSLILLFIILFVGITINEQVIREEVKKELNLQREQLIIEGTAKLNEMKAYGNDLMIFFLKSLRNYTVVLVSVLILLNTAIMSLLFRWRLKKERGILLKLEEKIDLNKKDMLDIQEKILKKLKNKNGE